MGLSPVLTTRNILESEIYVEQKGMNIFKLMVGWFMITELWKLGLNSNYNLPCFLPFFHSPS